MEGTTDFRLEEYILHTSLEACPADVAERAVGCMVDLVGALVAGSRSQQFAVGLAFAESVFGCGDVAVLGTERRLGLVGAAVAMGHASNAFDLDDGHNRIRAHPGSSFVGGLLATAYDRNVCYGDLLATLVVCYDVTVRMGEAIMDYYAFAHSSGTFGAVGTAAGVGRLMGLDTERLCNALCVAEFNAPLVPGIRSAAHPSMNKDGVPFGVTVGMLSVMETLSGFSGAVHLLQSEAYAGLMDDLGTRHAIMELYFKPYACCRWAHPAIDACIWLRERHGFHAQDVREVIVNTFERATQLSRVVPNTEEEAQYNLFYPVAAALVYGNFSVERAMQANLRDSCVTDMMRRIRVDADATFTALFPERRVCTVEIALKNGRRICSPHCEPRGEAEERVGLSWLKEKFMRVTSSMLTPSGQQTILKLLTGNPAQSVRVMLDKMNDRVHWR